MQESQKQELTQELLVLETQRNSGAPFPVARQTKAFLDKVKGLPGWEDSRSSTTASFLNLIRDTNTHREFFTSSDLKTRATELLIYLSHKLSPAEAQSIGLTAYQRMSTSEETLKTAQRISEPGGMIFETVKELPDPLADEAKRRGAQAGAVGTALAEKLKPAGQSLKQRFDTEGWTTPVVLGIVAAIMVFTKNKMLAILLSGGFLYAAYRIDALPLPATLKQKIT